MKNDTPLSRLLARLNFGKTEAPQAAADVAEVVQAQAQALTEEDQEAVTSLMAELDSAKAAAEGYKAKAAELEAQLSAMKAETDKLKAKAQAEQMNSRKQMLEAAVGSQKADELLLAVNFLDDDQFKKVVSAVTVVQDEEAKSLMFTEQGVSASAVVSDSASLASESKEMQLLKQKYPQQA